jgi:predicted NBD/HSP70 family sugar kinase
MGVVIDGRLRRGYTSHAGEFKSVLYHGKDFEQQLSISNEALANIENDESVLSDFFKELVDNLRFAHSLLDPRIIYIGGYLTKKEHLLKAAILNSQTENESDCFTIASTYEDDISEGASKLVLKYLFNLPTVTSRLKGWDAKRSPIGLDQ